MSKKKPDCSTSPKFKVGDRVRVIRGFMDVDYPDTPLGGWAGTVIKVDGADTFTVRWTEETMQAIHPVFTQRCEIDGLDPEEYALTGEDLEHDTGGPLQIEHPTKITTKPLSPKDQDDRIRMIFGLTSNDPLPVSAHQHHSGPPGRNAGRRPVRLLAPVQEPALSGPELLPIRLVLPFLFSIGPDRVGVGLLPDVRQHLPIVRLTRQQPV